MRGLVETAVRRRVTVVMVATAVLAFGIVGYSRLQIELFPDLTYPSFTVQTDFPDTAPQEVEYLVTRPVEEAVGVLRGLRSVRSVSRSGVSEVTLEFDWGTEMDPLLGEVHEKLDRIILPDEAENPIVLRFDPSLDPVMRIALSGDGDLTRMRYLAEHRIKQKFETVHGVASARVTGGFEEEIQIRVDQERLAALGIPISRIRQIVAVSNVNQPGGELRGEESDFLLRVENEYDNIEEIADLIVAQRDDAAVRLSEVARVYMGTKEREEITRVNGKEAIEFSIYREGDANTVTVSELVRERMADLQRVLPPGQDLAVLFDQSSFIRVAVDEVRNAALIGGILAVLVLFAFLREGRSTLIVATSIPLSVIATFVFMYRLGISLNIMSLGGLTLGIGMLVDNSIVVLESVFRKRKEGLSLARGSVEGTLEVGPAVLASTLTTVAVFLPIVFVEGVAGQLFRDQALAVTISILTSLVVAVTVIPMLSGIPTRGRGSTFSPGAAENETIDSSRDTPTRTLGVVSTIYDRIIRLAIRFRWATLGLAFGTFGVSLWSASSLGTELIPSLSEGEFYFEVTMPEGTSLVATDRIVGGLEKAAADESLDVAMTYATVGSRRVAGGLSLNTKGEHFGQINILMTDGADELAEAATAEKLRDRFSSVPDLDIKFGRPSYFSLKTPVEVLVFGDSLDEIRDYSIQFGDRLSRLPGLVDVRSSLEAGNPELQVIFDRDHLAALDLEMLPLSETLRNRVQGVVPTRFREDDRDIDIRIRNMERDRMSVDDIRKLIVPGPDGAPLRLLSVADIHLDRGPAEIHRVEQRRVAVITANVSGVSLGDAIDNVTKEIESQPIPPGMMVEIGGQNREMELSFTSLLHAIGLAVFLVYLVMASTFESFIHPLIVLFTIPMSLIGVVVGLSVTGTTITVIVLIGAIMLVGIVVNNAIVLIDTINRLRRTGVDKIEAVLLAGHVRLRPILMTTLTTVLGLLPMAIGWGGGSELRAPLAITVASGLIFSTLLTLVVIPAAYMVVPSRVVAEESFEETSETSRDAS